MNTVGARDVLPAVFVHVLARTSDPRVAIGQAVIFAGYRVGGAAGENAWLTAEELATRHRSQTHPPSR